MVAEQALAAASLEASLLGTPVHLLYFDRNLRCRYAAPDGPHFLGQSAEALVGKPAQTIFPATLPIVPRLERVLATQRTWWGEQIAYPAGPAGSWPAGHWNVHVQPWTLVATAPVSRASVRQTEREQPGHEGVLLCCLPCEGAVDTTAEGERSAVLLERMRTQLTVIRGFANLLQRRPQRELVAARSARIDGAVQQLTELLDDYERATQLEVQHPDLRNR